MAWILEAAIKAAAPAPDELLGPLSLAMSKALAAAAAGCGACSTVGVLVTELPVLLSLFL